MQIAGYGVRVLLTALALARPPVYRIGAAVRRNATTPAFGLLVLAAYTSLAWRMPELRFSWFSPTARVLLETVELCVALLTVLALLMPDDGDRLVARNAFVASLLVLGISNMVFGVGPLLLGEPARLRGLYSFYPWLAARYLVGALFIAAGLGRPRVGLRWYVLSVAAALVTVDLVFAAVRDNLPAPFVELEYTPGGVLVPVSSLPQVLVIAVIPGLLVGVGCWLAWQTYRGGASAIYAWVSAALAVNVLAKVHEVLYASVLGPAVTSADLFRVVFLVLLLAGALLKVRQVVVDRGVAVAALQRDLHARERLLRAMQEFTDREQSFRSLVVHELGTPIATLRTLAHVLAEADHQISPQRRRTAAKGMETESRRLQELVDRMEQLRDLELEDFRCDLRPVQVRPLIEDAAMYARGLHGGHEVRVSWGCEDVRVRADPGLLGQALRNVLSNAAHYSPDKTPITLHCRLEGQVGVQIAVIDRGPGIPADERDRVLGRFERGAAGSGTPGTGLGLYVASRVADAHGGQLLIGDGEDGRGTRVVLELQRAE